MSNFSLLSRLFRSFILLLVSIGTLLMVQTHQKLSAQTLLHVSPTQTDYNLNNALDILEDKTGTLTFADVRSSTMASAFKRYTGTSDPNYGHTASVFWVRVSLLLPPPTRAGESHHDWFLEIAYPQLDDIRFFEPEIAEQSGIQTDSTRYSMRLSGDMLPFSARDISYRMPTFRLNMPETLDSTVLCKPIVYYFRFASQGSMTFPMMLRTQESLSRHIVNEQFLLGMFYGVLAIMIAYNLFVYFSLRDISYLYYVSYIAVYGLFLFIWNGLAFQYLWAESPVWHNRSIIVFMGLSGLTVFRFSQSYLDTSHITPRAHRFMNVMMLYFLVGIVLAFFLPYGVAIRIMYGGPIFTLPIILTVSVICIRKGYRPARYFLVAWILLLTSIMMAALRNLNLLPSGALTIYGLQIGSAFEIFLLSLGLADRINIIKQEKKVAQDAAIKSTELLIETLRQNEQELEGKVRERTTALQDANEEISRQLEIQSEQAREIELANTTLQEQNLIIEQERENSQNLLLNILPSSIAARLMAGEQLIADRFNNVTVLFADIVGFTRLSAVVEPEELVGLLDTVFSEFDTISERCGMEKIKTIGDCYMAVSGLPTAQDNHAERATEAALAMMTAIADLNTMFTLGLEMRIGLHCGTVVAGVIGKRKFAYDLWGDAVNTASRMESRGEAGKIHISHAVYEALHWEKNAETDGAVGYAFEKREPMEIKGKGLMQTWFVERVG